MAVSRRLRFEILRRDGYACRYCGAKAPDVVLTVDHVVPVALGGGDEPNNLVTACQPCNAGKSSIAPDAKIVEDVDATALLFAKAVEIATARRRAHLLNLEMLLGNFNDTWESVARGNRFGRPDDWTYSIERFLAEGLTNEELDIFVFKSFDKVLSSSQVWRYFCGCCWNEIGKRHELARRLIEDSEV